MIVVEGGDNSSPLRAFAREPRDPRALPPHVDSPVNIRGWCAAVATRRARP